jgi:hypothetical protein
MAGIKECTTNTIKNNGKINVCNLNAKVLSNNPKVRYEIVW